jgi:peroxiredoxin
MTTITPLIPRQSTPELEISLVGGGKWGLSAQSPQNFTMIVVYRGFHCPICSRYLADLNRKVDEFSEQGVNVVVVSSDDEARAAQAKQDWGLDKLDVGFGLSLEEGRKWGLYISKGRGATSTGVVEPDLFLEPGLFLIRPNGELYFVTVQSMPFARPAFADILGAVKFVIANDYPGRGEVVD